MILLGTDNGVCWELPCFQVSRATGDALWDLAWPLAAGIRASRVAQDAPIHAAEPLLDLCWLWSELRHPAHMDTSACRGLTAPQHCCAASKQVRPG